MVSKANEDLPEPLRPVMTVRVLRGISTSMFLRLCWRAPRTVILVMGIDWTAFSRSGPFVMWTDVQRRLRVTGDNSAYVSYWLTERSVNAARNGAARVTLRHDGWPDLGWIFRWGGEFGHIFSYGRAGGVGGAEPRAGGCGQLFSGADGVGGVWVASWSADGGAGASGCGWGLESFSAAHFWADP